MGKRIDLTGQRFGRLVVTGYGYTKKENWGSSVAVWDCICDCGNKTQVKSGLLRGGHVRSCGCLKHKHSHNFKDLTGERFGRLVVKELHGVNKYSKPIWLCQCDCGNTKLVQSGYLKTGHTLSCGCYQKEVVKSVNITHGLTYSKVRRTWRNMLDRCENPKNKNYKNYGGRGISVCPKWHDLAFFAEWAYNNGFSEEKTRNEQTLERIDVNGNYEPKNCCFIPFAMQASNKRNSKKLTCNGETHTVSEWSRITGISRPTISRRLKKGMSIEDVLEMR